MKFDQIAYACYSGEAETKLKKALGLEDRPWVIDEVTTVSTLYDDVGGVAEVRNKARLQFNYDLGIEVELLRYLYGSNFHERHPYYANYLREPFASHQGAHLAADEEFPAMEGFPLVQESWTKTHTTAFLTDPKSEGYGRKYHYRIHQLSPGSFVKFIKRINPK